MKKCFKCGIEKPFSDFYKHNKMGDGFLGKCKDCTKKDVAEHIEKCKQDIKWVEKERARSREKYHRLGNKKPTYENKKAAINQYKQNYPEKYAAKHKSQRIPKVDKKNHLHHWNYNLAMDVIELSIAEHNTAHRFMIYDQEHYLYRTLSNELLDTRQKHIGYLKSLGIQIE